jgi:hypothetical protein
MTSSFGRWLTTHRPVQLDDSSRCAADMSSRSLLAQSTRRRPGSQRITLWQSAGATRAARQVLRCLLVRGWQLIPGGSSVAALAANQARSAGRLWSIGAWPLCTRSGSAATARHTVALKKRGSRSTSMSACRCSSNSAVAVRARMAPAFGRSRSGAVVGRHPPNWSLCWQRSQRDCGGEEGRPQRSGSRVGVPRGAGPCSWSLCCPARAPVGPGPSAASDRR